MAERGTIHRPGWWYLCVEPVHLCVFLRQKQAMDAPAEHKLRLAREQRPLCHMSRAVAASAWTQH